MICLFYVQNFMNLMMKESKVSTGMWTTLGPCQTEMYPLKLMYILVGNWLRQQWKWFMKYFLILVSWFLSLVKLQVTAVCHSHYLHVPKSWSSSSSSSSSSLICALRTEANSSCFCNPCFMGWNGWLVLFPIPAGGSGSCSNCQFFFFHSSGRGYASLLSGSLSHWRMQAL